MAVTGVVYGWYDPEYPEEMRYIGMTTDLEARKKTHRRDSKTGNTYKYKWWRSISPREPEYVVLFQQVLEKDCAMKVLGEQERALKKAYEAAGHPLTNLTDGGDGSLGWRASEETRQKMSEAHSGEKNWLFGKRMPQETRDKIREALLGEKSPSFGKPVSEETRKKLSDAATGRVWEEDRVRAWCGEGHPNSKLTESQVLAIRADSRANREIAADFGISRRNVSMIKTRKTWTHV